MVNDDVVEAYKDINHGLGIFPQMRLSAQARQVALPSPNPYWLDCPTCKAKAYCECVSGSPCWSRRVASEVL